MKFQALFFLLLLTCTCLSLAQGSYGNCCLGYVSSLKPRARRNIESYRMQETDGDCNIRAVVFQMRRRKTQSRPVTLCANPNKQWVKDLLKDLDRRKRA